MKTKHYLAFLGLALLILFLRHPDTLLHAQFWAEDGRVWFANAYNLGSWKSLFLSQDGYYQTLSRLTAIVAMWFPLSKGPLIFNITALLVQVIPAFLLVSRRFEKLVPRLEVRILLAALFLLLPNTNEVHGNLTNAQWFLAISAFLVIVADIARTRAWQVFDYCILILAGLSGPFAIFLAPIALINWYFQREKQRLYYFLIVSACAATQVFQLLFLNHGSRIHALQDLTPRLIFAVIGRQIIWGPIIGASGYNWILNNIPFYFWFFAITTFIAIALMIYIFWKSPLQLKLLIIFAAMIYAATLLSPTGDYAQSSVLKFLSRATDGVRYWLVPMLAFVFSLVWGALKADNKIARYTSRAFLGLMIIGIIIEFVHPPYKDFHYNDELNHFQTLSPGEKAIIPINPSGWTMELIKK
jgi:hypothetical protein